MGDAPDLLDLKDHSQRFGNCKKDYSQRFGKNIEVCKGNEYTPEEGGGAAFRTFPAKSECLA